MMSEIKKILCDVLIPIIVEFKKKRNLVTDDMVDAFMAVRPLNF